MRRALRARRAELSAAQRLAAARLIATHIAGTRWLHGGRAVGLYAGTGYEVATGPICELARRRHCPVYLPRIHDYRQQRMVFALESAMPARRNRYGILEPGTHKIISARALSIVFMPVLGFDARGARLGSGAGYYDRVFAFRRHRHSWHRPLLVGIAFRRQEVERIDLQEHDVLMDALVSEEGVRYFRATEQ
jgi:5-formyltetrahydrofolate cyclo-ligase